MGDFWYNRGMVEREDKPIKFRKSLRNANINYRNGWFFVTSQVAHNKSILGAIVGEECALNSLGKKVREYWLERFDQEHAEIESLLKHNRIDRASVATDGDYVAELIKMFKQR